MRQIRIKHVEPGDKPMSLVVTWKNCARSTVDISPPIRTLKGLASLRAPAKFRKVRVGEWGWSVVWPGGIDMSAATLARMAREQSGEAMPAERFRAWRVRNKLSLSGAAAALGLSRRMIAYYDSGEREIPKTVWLACLGWKKTAQRRAA